jgi:hypothetical protein
MLPRRLFNVGVKSSWKSQCLLPRTGRRRWGRYRDCAKIPEQDRDHTKTQRCTQHDGSLGKTCVHEVLDTASAPTAVRLSLTPLRCRPPKRETVPLGTYQVGRGRTAAPAWARLPSGTALPTTSAARPSGAATAVRPWARRAGLPSTSPRAALALHAACRRSATAIGAACVCGSATSRTATPPEGCSDY